jgi:hypothetical protein
MSRCRHCERKHDRPSAWADRTHEMAEILIPALRHIAYRSGYALAVHGSLNYDIDLLAAPWRELAVSPTALAQDLKEAIEKIAGQAYEGGGEQPTKKPCGRLAWSFHLGGGPYVDLSVMPRPEDLKQPEADTSDYPWLAGESK